MIPIISAILFRFGGWGKEDGFCPFFPFVYPQKFDWLITRGRELIGVLLGLFYWNLWLGLSLVLVVQIPYGDNNKNWLRKIVGRDINWLIYGFCFGVISFFKIGWWSLLQGIISSLTFWFLMKWSNDGIYKKKLNHSYVELGTGFMGVLYTWML